MNSSLVTGHTKKLGIQAEVDAEKESKSNMASSCEKQTGEEERECER